jgi:hypothetical protein
MLSSSLPSLPPQRGPYEELLDDLRALVLEPAQLGQLPVFMAHLGAAVKQERSHYPLYAMFRPVRVPKSVHDYVWGSGCVDSVSQLRRYLVSGCTAVGVTADNGRVQVVWSRGSGNASLKLHKGGTSCKHTQGGIGADVCVAFGAVCTQAVHVRVRVIPQPVPKQEHSTTVLISHVDQASQAIERKS